MYTGAGSRPTRTFSRKVERPMLSIAAASRSFTRIFSWLIVDVAPAGIGWKVRDRRRGLGAQRS